ncbi:major facilitator superfamily domain-containing protein [Cercophora newfieldiana]|uniref:Major facilitator superfamily domain-containing protein n=1 Tax=Cercophora newfieldiana TaxID=92897 RepID=A0AA39YD86_9PEZI|nr:major facilitator superfamily domain-containing protein [Cercophora newfieldiana]
MESSTFKEGVQEKMGAGEQIRSSDQPSKHEDIEKQSIEDLEEESHDEEIEEAELASSTGDDEANDDAPASGLSRVISRVLSRTSVKSVPPSPPPDGGIAAWTAVACAHLVVMNTWGFIGTFGVFQAYYANSLGRPPADISWIGSFQIFLLFFIGALTGRLTDAGFFRAVFLVGTVLQLLGIFSSSFAGGSYWQLFLAQGVCMGLGNGFLFCPSMAIVSTYFSKKRALAIGIVACGSGTGGLVFPSVARQLLPTVGFAWTMRTIGFLQLAALVVCNFFFRPRIAPKKSGMWLDLAAFKEWEYTFYVLGSFCCLMGVFFGFYYIAAFARQAIGVSYTESLNLLLVLNGMGIPGRLLPNHLADRFGPINIFIPTGIIAGTCILSWMAVNSVTGLYVWAVFYGMAAGGIQSLFPAGLSSLTTDLRKAGIRLGMAFSIISFATLVGPPIAGVIITLSGGSYQGAQVFAGVSMLVGTAFMGAAKMARIRRVKGNWRTKV